jgi:mannitol/fructose-specific phosphotransferase system IIA component (Ntr-type)
LRLHELIPVQQIRVGLRAGSKREIIEQLVALLPLADSGNRSAVLDVVMERESVLTTGIGRGVAVPHGKTPAVDGLMASMAIHADGLPFEAIDGQPCTIFILLVSHPDNSGPHIRALAQVARMLNQEKLKRAFIEAPTAEAVVEAFRAGEAQ